jgi:hypothetical protein
MIAEKTQKRLVDNDYVSFLRIYLLVSITHFPSHPDSTASIFTAPNNLNDEAALGFVGRGMTLGYMLCPGVEPLVKVTASFQNVSNLVSSQLNFERQLAHRLRDSSATELGAR